MVWAIDSQRFLTVLASESNPSDSCEIWCDCKAFAFHFVSPKHTKLIKTLIIFPQIFSNQTVQFFSLFEPKTHLRH